MTDEHSIRSSPSILPLQTPTGPHFPITPFDPVPESEEKSNDDHASPEMIKSPGVLQHIYMTISYLLGFKETWSLTLFFIFGGALVGFVLARSFMLDPRSANIRKNMPPAEWYSNHRAPYRGALIAHIWSSFFIAWGVIFQFMPSLRRDYVALHRANGYGTLFLIPASVSSGWVVARHAFGGAPVTQALFYLLGLSVLVTGTIGMLNFRDTRQHRKWMLRMSALLGVIISARLIMLATRAILTDIGTYYALFSCDEIRFLTGSSLTEYPACAAALANNTTLTSVYVAIHASMNEKGLNANAAIRLSFPVGLWMALVIHIVGVELYIHLTEKQNRHREGYILTRL